MMALVPGRFTTAAIRIDGGELEVRLSDGGHWQVKAKMVEEDDWRSLCRGHLDGSIFDTTKPDRKAPVRVGPLLVDPAGRRVEVHGRGVRLLAREFEVVALLAIEPDRVFTKQELKRELWEIAAASAPSTPTSVVRGASCAKAARTASSSTATADGHIDTSYGDAGRAPEATCRSASRPR